MRNSSTTSGASHGASARSRPVRKAKLEAERKERERLEQLERERIDRLIGDADQLRRAQAIRACVADCESQRADHANTLMGTEPKSRRRLHVIYAPHSRSENQFQDNSEMSSGYFHLA
jgi:hypothetical protein